MLVVISPAKRLNESASSALPVSMPALQDSAEFLAQTASKLSTSELGKLMHLSDNLAKLNHGRFTDWEDLPLAPAALMFDGDTYAGLEAATLDDDAMRYAADHLRILSGLYGLLRPLDMIKPYRLEMGTRLKTKRGKNLYDYWGSSLSEALNAQASATGSRTLVNCASQEYFGAVDLATLDLEVITPAFYEMKNGTPKIISFFAKKARGAMARYIVENRLTEAESLLEFDAGGYVYESDLSTPGKPSFLRRAEG